MVDPNPSPTSPSPPSQPSPQETTPPPAPASPPLQEQFPRYTPPTPQPETSPLVPSIPQKGKTSKGLIFVLIILLLALGGATGLLGYQNYQLKQQIQQLQTITPTPTPAVEPTLPPTPTPTPDLTADWKIYTNQNYNYEVKWPPELAADEKGKVDDQIIDLTYFILPERPGATASISVLAESYESVISRLESEWWGGTEESPNQVGETTVAGINAKKVTGTQAATGYELYEVIFPRGNITYRISLYIGPKEEELGLNEETFNLILSSFKFLD
jgi:hypothetical protein